MTVQINPEIGKKSFNFPWIGLHKNAYSPAGNNCMQYPVAKVIFHL